MDAISGDRSRYDEGYGFWGVTGAWVPRPWIAGEPLDGSLLWTAIGPGYHWRFSNLPDWGAELAGYVGAAWALATPNASTDLAVFVRARIGRRWALEGDEYLTVAGSVLWFRAEDDRVDEFVTHHGIFAISVGWAVFDMLPTGP